MTERQPLSAGYGAMVTVLLALATYLLALHNGFAFDDAVLIPRDARVTNGELGALITTSYWKDAAMALYRPLTSLTFGLDWAAADGSAAWFHFTNVLWHMLASVLVYVLLLRYFEVGAALLGGALFAVHPVHVEAVANVVGRAELIAATLVLAGCVAWPRISNGAARAVIVPVIYFLALCAKESAAVLPALLVLVDFTEGEWSFNSIRDYLRRRSPALLALVAAFVIFMVARTMVLGTLTPARLDPSIEVTGNAWHRVLTALQAWPIALRLMLFPWTLLADYGPQILMPIAEWNSLAVLGATMLIGLLGGGLIALAYGYRVAALALLWYPITILPVSNFLLPICVLLGERTLYLPSVAAAFAAAALFTWALRRPEALKFVKVAGAVVIFLFAVRSMIRVPEWQSTGSILFALVRDRPDAFRGQWHVARDHRQNGRIESALANYDEAVRLWPYREGLVQEAATYASSQGRAVYARDLALFGARRWPRNVVFHRLAAANALDVGDTATARTVLINALQQHPRDTLLNQMWRAAAPAAQPR